MEEQYQGLQKGSKKRSLCLVVGSVYAQSMHEYNIRRLPSHEYRRQRTWYTNHHIHELVALNLAFTCWDRPDIPLECQRMADWALANFLKVGNLHGMKRQLQRTFRGSADTDNRTSRQQCVIASFIISCAKEVGLEQAGRQCVH